MAWTLCSKSDVTALHPIQESDLKDEWSDMVEGLIRQHLGQPYLGTSQAIVNELRSGDGTYTLHVKSTPIISVQSLSINDVPLSGSDYAVFPNYIVLYDQVFPQGILNISVSYTSGNTSPDATVRLCAAAMVIAIINYQRRAGADGSRKWGTAEQKVGQETDNQNLGLTSHLEKIMKRTLRRSNVRVRV